MTAGGYARSVQGWEVLEEIPARLRENPPGQGAPDLPPPACGSLHAVHQGTGEPSRARPLIGGRSSMLDLTPKARCDPHAQAVVVFPQGPGHEVKVHSLARQGGQVLVDLPHFLVGVSFQQYRILDCSSSSCTPAGRSTGSRWCGPGSPQALGSVPLSFERAAPESEM